MKKSIKKLSVCLLFGGKSVEHDISILSGLQVYHALDKTKYDVHIVYITKNNIMLMGKSLDNIDTYKNEKYLSSKYKRVHIETIENKCYLVYKNAKTKIDIFIPIVHGEGTEDGTISAILEFYNATYINANLTSSAIAQDKIYTKNILEKYNIKTPKYIYIDTFTSLEENIKNIKEQMHFPLILKSARLGSSIGIEKVQEVDELKDKLTSLFMYSNRIIVEELLPNIKEYNCAAFKYNNNIYISNIEEVISNSDYLNFEEKYIKENKNKESSSRIIPAKILKILEDEIKALTLNIYKILDMNGVIRIDYIYDTKNNQLYFNEVNTIPGSLAFYLYQDKGIRFNILLDMLIKEALLSKINQSKYIKTFNSNVLNQKGKKISK